MTDLTLNQFQAGVAQTMLWPEAQMITYPILALGGEVGELQNTYKKALRGDDLDKNGDLSPQKTEDRRKKMIDELGDVLWYVAAVAYDLEVSLEDVARTNRQKLSERHGHTYSE